MQANLDTPPCILGTRSTRSTVPEYGTGVFGVRYGTVRYSGYLGYSGYSGYSGTRVLGYSGTRELGYSGTRVLGYSGTGVLGVIPYGMELIIN